MTDQQQQGARLKTLLALIGSSQSALAQQLGFTRGYISLMVNGEKPISQQMLNGIIQRFPKVNIHWLMSGVGTPMVEDKAVETYQIPDSVEKLKESSEPGYGLIEQLQAEVASLRGGLEDLKKRFEEFRSGEIKTPP